MRKYLSEYLGTFILIFCGTGAAIVDETMHGSVTHVGVAIIFGLIVMALIYAFGDISGAHINPAVTMAFTAAKLFPVKELVPYLLAQLAGAVSASSLLAYLFPSSVTLGATLPANGWQQSFILEIILTCILMLVVFRVSTGSKEQGLFAGAAIGSVVLVEAMFAGPVSGASMNPARSLAPALVSRHWESVWIYLTAPFIGALLAVLFYRILKNKS